MTHLQQGLLFAAGVVLAFGIGFGWQYLRAENLEEAFASTEAELALRSLEGTLGAAAIEAQRGSFEAARTLTSEFFTGLQQNVDAAPLPAQEELRGILDERDAIITALSRAEPAAGEALVRLFVRYRVAIGGPDQALPVAFRESDDPLPVVRGRFGHAVRAALGGPDHPLLRVAGGSDRPLRVALGGADQLLPAALGGSDQPLAVALLGSAELLVAYAGPHHPPAVPLTVPRLPPVQ